MADGSATSPQGKLTPLSRTPTPLIIPNSNSWCDPFKTWQKAYSFNPVANLTAEQSKLVMGGTSPSFFHLPSIHPSR